MPGDADVTAALTRVATCLLGAARRATNLLRPGQVLAGEGELAEPRFADLIALSDVDGARAWLEAERANLIALANQLTGTGEPLCRYPLRLQAAMTIYLAGAGHLADWQHLCELSIRHAHSLRDPLAEAIALMNIGAIACRQGRFTQALRDLNKALALSREAKRPSTQAAVLSYLASAYSETGDAQKASACHEEAIALRRQVGDARSISHTLANAAQHLIAQRRLDVARRYLDESLAIKYTGQDLGGAAASEVQLAAVLLAQGDDEAAVRGADAGLVLCRRYGDRFHEWIALLLRSLGRGRLGQWQLSADDAAECVAACVALGQITAANYVAALSGLSPAGRDGGDPLPSWLISALDQAGETPRAREPCSQVHGEP